MKRRTEQRRIIQNIFQETLRPLSPIEVLDKAKEKMEKISMATVYRNLKFFHDRKWLTKVELPNEAARYERSDLGHHHHFQCRDCDRLFDLDGCPENIYKLIPNNFTLYSHEVTLYGSCRECHSSIGD